MEHIVQFGINIDDSAIQRNVEGQATSFLLRSITDDVKKQLGKQDRWEPDTWVHTQAIEIINEILEDERQFIIDRVVENLTRSVSNSKAYKEAVKAKILTMSVEDMARLGIGGDE